MPALPDWCKHCQRKMQGMNNLIAHGAIKQGNDCWHGVAWCYTKDIQHKGSTYTFSPNSCRCWRTMLCTAPVEGLSLWSLSLSLVALPCSLKSLGKSNNGFQRRQKHSADIQKHCPAEHNLRSALPAQGKMVLVQMWLAVALPLSMMYSWASLC
jgi:hypothetical protein